MLLFALTGCGGSRAPAPSGTEAPGDDIFVPLEVGLRWESAVEITTRSGHVFRGRSVREITGMKSIGGESYYVHDTSFIGLPGMESFTVYLRKAADGIYAINGFDPDQREYLSTKLPLDVGTTWTAVTIDRTVATVEAREDVVLNGKTYEDCLKIVRTADGESPSGTYFLAPGVGTILDVARQGGDTYRFTLESMSGGE